MKNDFNGKTVYVCSPYAGDISKNKAYARENTKEVIKRGGNPITPHLYITEVLDDGNADERERGLQIGLNLLDKCDILCVFTEFGVSAGMQKEIEYAKEKGLLIKEFTKGSEEYGRQRKTYNHI